MHAHSFTYPGGLHNFRQVQRAVLQQLMQVEWMPWSHNKVLHDELPLHITDIVSSSTPTGHNLKNTVRVTKLNRLATVQYSAGKHRIMTLVAIEFNNQAITWVFYLRPEDMSWVSWLSWRTGLLVRVCWEFPPALLSRVEAEMSQRFLISLSPYFWIYLRR